MEVSPDVLAADRIGVAVSGGSDSLGLLLLALRTFGPGRVHAATVDHRLREASDAEARHVTEFCARHGMSHTILRWNGRPSGNLPASARKARYTLLAEWAAGAEIEHVLIGHTRDDQAETVLLQMRRQAGLSGLSGMRPVLEWGAVRFHRPLLGTSRTALRDMLADAGEEWIEDPTNEDVRYDRVRTRKALDVLDELGISRATVAASAARLRQTDDGLRHLLRDWAQRHARVEAGDVEMDGPAVEDLPPDIARRIVAAAITFVTGADYPPRAASVLRVVQGLPRSATLGGCLIYCNGGAVVIGREPAEAEMATASAIGALWDGRFVVRGQSVVRSEVRALGEAGLRHLPDWRSFGIGRRRLLATPAIWSDGGVLSVPLLQPASGQRLICARDDFPQWLVSH